MTGEIFGNWHLSELSVRGDQRGQLVALEGSKEVPFDIARVYYIFGTEQGEARGFHAHRKVMQYAICVSGSCTMRLDDGVETREVSLNRPDQALYLGPMVWHEMHDFSPECVLLVLADAPYDEGDYVRDYAEFIRLVRARGA